VQNEPSKSGNMASNPTKPREPSVVNARYNARKFAKILGVSTRQLQRNFNHYLKRSPQDWLNEQRIAAARQMLLSGESVKRVAFELGFKQVSHFCRQFKAYNHMTPSQFTNKSLNRPVANG
jgi:AraC family transcriptional regulator, dual regulator of chb operon